MAKLNWNRPVKSDGPRAWEPKQKQYKLPVEHTGHELKRVKTEHHFGKLVCITCNDKFVKWLSQDEYFKY